MESVKCRTDILDLFLVLADMFYYHIQSFFYMWIFLAIAILTTLLFPCMSSQSIFHDSVVYFFQWYLFDRAVVTFKLSVVWWREWDGWVGGGSTREEMLDCQRIGLEKISNVTLILKCQNWSLATKVCIQFTVCKFILSINLGRKCCPALRMLWNSPPAYFYVL